MVPDDRHDHWPMSVFATTIWIVWFMLTVCVIAPMSEHPDLVETLPSVLPPVGLPPLFPWRINRTLTATHESSRSASRVPARIPGSMTCNQTVLSASSTCWNNHTSASLIDQSNTCTPQQDAQRIQCLRELPAESYEVLEGEDVQMRCRVAHQRGKAQWRARHYLLGYKRNIPSWPRYSMQGDPRQGEHDLVITNVTHEDAGTYECQVSPVAGQSPLRRQTTLSILVKPSQPVIVAPSGEPQPTPNGRLTVPLRHSTPGERNLLRLSCQSHGGNPPPIFEWFHNGLVLNKTTTSSDTDFLTNTGRGDDFAFRIPGVEYHSAELILDKEQLRTGDRLVCLISNKATQRSKKLSQQKLRAELYVIIHSPPGNPEIIDWSLKSNASQILTEGAPLEATCRSSPAGNPPGELVWRWESSSSDSAEGKASLTPNPVTRIPQIITPIPAEYAVQQHMDEKLLSKVRITQVNSSQHGMDLVCAVKHPIGPEKSARIPVFVRYGPQSVDIHGPEETVDLLKEAMDKRLHLFQTDRDNRGTRNATSAIRYVYQDRPQYLLCLTSPYFDRAQIQWYGLLNISGQWHPIAPLESFTRVLATGQKNFILASMIQLVSTNSERTPLRWTAIKCVSKADVTDAAGIHKDVSDLESNKAVMKIIDLKSYVPPGKPSISGYKQNMLYQEGTNITLSCEARAGIPPGYLVWLESSVAKASAEKTRHSLVIPNTTTLAGPDGMIRSTLIIQLTREQNGHFYQCASENKGFPRSEVRVSDSVQMGVAFAATSITMTVADETGRALFPRDHTLSQNSNPNQSVRLDKSHNPPIVSAQAGGKVAVKCHMDLSNPRPKIQWRLYRCPTHTVNLSEQISFKDLTKDCVIETIQGIIYRGTEENVFDEKVIESQILLALNWSHHGDIIECVAEPQVPWAMGPDQVSVHIKDGLSQPRLRERVLMNILFAPLFLRPAQHLNWPVEKMHVGLFEHRLPQFIVVDGGAVDLDLEPSANPEVTSFVWYKNEEMLSTSAATSGSFDERISVHHSVLRIKPVRVADMANYTLLATNSLGTARFRFFLNVTYGPQLIGSPILNITVAGRKALLECQAKANPTPSENAVRWRRISHSFAHLDPVHKFYRASNNAVTMSESNEQQQSIADSVKGIRCNKGTWHNGFKYFAKCWNPSPGVLASSLTIYDLGPSDVGRYQCHMDNAVGSPAVRIVDLIYPFAPQVVPVPRWTKSAPGKGYEGLVNNSSDEDPSAGVFRARLTCVIAAEPKPTVEWIREPANLTLVEGGQFRSQIKAVRPGLYHAVLFLNKPRDVDLGKYYCKAKNLVGEDAGQVELGTPTAPDLPTKPRLLNATSTTLAVAWTQGYNGGSLQKFKLRWASNENPDKFTEADISEDLDRETIAYEIKGLQKITSYRVAVSASNAEHGTSGFTQYLLASTTARDPIPDKEAMHDEARVKSFSTLGHWDTKGSGPDDNDESQRRLARAGLDVQTSEDKAVVIIIAASIFGSLVLVANLLIIAFLAQRHRKKLHQQRRSSIFMGNELVQLCPATNPYGGDMTINSRPSYTGYMDGSSLNEDMLLQNQSNEHFMAYHPNLSPVAVNICSDGSNVMKSNNSFTGSPHPSLQAINPLSMPSPTHMDYNPSGLQLPASRLGEQEFTGLTYLNTDTNPSVAITEYNQHGAIFALNEMGLTAPLLQHAERRTPMSIRMNAGVPVYPQVIQRMDSPNSGAASSISAARSAGYPNASSLERNTSFFIAPRTPSQHNMASLIRQTNLGQTTSPGGTFGRPVVNYVQSPGSQQMNTRSGSSTFTPTHTMMNGRVRTGAMAISYYADREPGSNSSYSEKTPSVDLITSPGAGQLVRRGSYNTYKPHNVSNRMNTSQLLDTYLQRYNDQLQSVRAMNQQGSSARYQCEMDGSRGSSDRYRLPVIRPTGLDVQPHSNTESAIIPPPNAFGAHSPRGPRVPVQASADSDPPLYHGSGMENLEFDLNHGPLATVTVLPSPGNMMHPPQINVSNAPVKHPSPNQALIFQNDGQDGYPRYGCIV
ncbi:Nephrin [Fasciola hepatica]|uniref:Nephrin n=1 Tax=Fasciola hepatica TaxID=6192 RepID=A0A4E0RLR1_FASHE|nr:Nephrin [Fasciola hepatica]